MPEEFEETDIVTIMLYCLAPITLLGALVAITYWMYRRYGPHKEAINQPPIKESLLRPEAAAEISVSPPELTGEVIARGRFGTVQVACMEGDQVAVKILHSGHKDSWQAWQRERDTYRLPGLASHPHILHFIAALQYNDQLWLVTQLHRHGCLTDYLKANVITWQELLTISCTMVEGLAFLHDDLVLFRWPT
jgi:serine/threonine protein kinase